MAVDFFRKHYDNVLMVIGFALTFFMLTNATRLLLKLDSLTEPEYLYTQAYRLLDEELSEETMERILENFEDIGMNCKVDGSYLTVGDLFSRMPVSVYLSAEADSQSGLVDVAAWESMQNSLVLGRTIKEFTYETAEGTKILLGGLEYSVFEYRNEKELEDNSIFICWENLEPAYREALLDGMNENYTSYEEIYFVLESNDTIGTGLSDFLTAMGDRLLPFDAGQNTNYLVSFQTELLGKVTGVLTVFSAVCSVLITDLWISRRKREYLIRRVFGYEVKDIVVLIIKESGRVALFSLLLAWGMEVVYLVSRNGFSLGLQREFMGILLSAVGAAVIQGLVLIWPLRQLLRIHPTQGAIDSVQ